MTFRHLRPFCSLWTLVLCAVAVSPAAAWHAPGHMITAAIAFYRLGPQRAHRVADVLRSHPQYAEWMHEKPASIPEDEYLFMRASTWADDIRSEDNPGHAFSHPTWHYTDRWFLFNTTSAPADERGEHIEQAVAINENLVKSSQDPAERARALAWLFHLFGDIEMPLHATSLVSPQFPRGDAGGNREWIVSDGHTMNLHSYWDGLWDRELETRREDGRYTSDLTKVDALARDIAASHPHSAMVREYPAARFSDVVGESYELAKAHVYLNGALHAGADRNDAAALPPGYEAEARKLGDKRMAIGGYRLADELRGLLKL